MKTTKMMRALLIVLSLVMALSLFSCTTEEEVVTTAPGTDAPTEESTTESSAETTVETTVSEEETETTGTETSATETETSATETETSATETETSATESETSDTEATETSDTETTESSETETTDTEETECTHADKEEVAAKAANCKKGGNEAYVICNACGVMWNTDGAVIEAIPETAIDPENHLSYADVPARLPTTKEEGNDAYSECRGCRKYWNVDGEEITEDQIVTYPKIVPTTEKYWGAAELGNMSVSSSVGSTFKPTAVADDRSYTRFERDGTSSRDGAFYIVDNKDSTEVTGQYIIMKYRTDHVTQIELFATTEGGVNGNAHTYPTMVADGEWHLLIVNLADALSAYVIAEEDGSYILTWARLDILDAAASEGYFDIAWLVTCDNPADVAGIMQEGDKDLCTHIEAPNPEYTDCEDGYYHTANCAICDYVMYIGHSISGVPSWNAESLTYGGECICGATVALDALYVAEPNAAGSHNSFKDEEIDGFVRYTKNGTADPYIHIYKSGKAVTGQYAIVKYRIDKAGMSFNNSFVGSAAGNHKATATSGCDTNKSSTASGSFVGDGEWHYVIIEGKSDCFVANEDGTYSFAFLRLGLSSLAVGDYLDVDEIAFVDNLDAANNYIFKNTPGNTPENPIWVEDVANTSIKVGAGKTVYVNARASGMILTLTGNATIVHNEATYEALENVVVVPECYSDFGMPCTFAITNNGEEDATYTMTFTWPVGARENPVDIVLGENSATVKEKSQGYYFTYVATDDGKLTLTITSEGGWTYTVNNLTSLAYGEIQRSDSDPVVNPVEIDVKAGDELQIIVNTYNPEDEWNAPAGTVTFTAAFKFACEHTNKTAHDAKDATCTEDGNKAYSVCDSCGRIFNSEGVIIDEIPVIPAAHKYVEHAAVAPTCTDDGAEAYKSCSACDVLWNANGDVIEAVVVVPATGHSQYDVAAREAGFTSSEWGCVAHIACHKCDAVWTPDGAAANREDVIFPSETQIEIFFDAEAISKFTNNMGDKVTITVEEDGSYVRFARVDTLADGNIMVLSGNTKVTGQYLIFKYRTDHAAGGEIWNNTTENGHSGGKSNHGGSYLTDGAWHFYIVNLAEKSPNYIKANANGEYIIQWSRLDILNASAATGYFDLAWIAFCDDITDVAAVVTEDDKNICTHPYKTTGCVAACKVCGAGFTQHTLTETHTDEGNVRTYAVTCANCDQAYTYSVTFGAEKPEIYLSAIDIAKKSYPATRMGLNEFMSENGVGFVRLHSDKNATAEAYFNIIPGGNNIVAGRYMVIKYRTDASAKWQFYGGDQSKPNAGNGACFDVAPVADGEWHYMILDLETYMGDHYNPVDDVYHLGHMRCDIWNTPPKAVRYIDIAYIAFSDDLSTIGAIDAEKTEIAHDHLQGNNSMTAYDDEDENTFSAKKTYTCAFCGEAQTTELASTSHVSSFVKPDGSNIIATGKLGGDRGVTELDASTYEADLVVDMKLGVYTWTVIDGYYNGMAYRVLNSDGSVLVDWTESEILDHKVGAENSDAQLVANASGISGATIDMVQKFAAIADLTAAAGKTVTVEYAVIWRDAPATGNDKYVTYARITNVAVPSAE